MENRALSETAIMFCRSALSPSPHLQQHAQMRRHSALGRDLPRADRHEEVLRLGELPRTQLRLTPRRLPHQLNRAHAQREHVRLLRRRRADHLSTLDSPQHSDGGR